MRPTELDILRCEAVATARATASDSDVHAGLWSVLTRITQEELHKWALDACPYNVLMAFDYIDKLEKSYTELSNYNVQLQMQAIEAGRVSYKARSSTAWSVCIVAIITAIIAFTLGRHG